MSNLSSAMGNLSLYINYAFRPIQHPEKRNQVDKEARLRS